MSKNSPQALLPGVNDLLNLDDATIERNPQTGLYEAYDQISGKLIAVIGDQNRLADYPQSFVEHETTEGKILVQVGVGVDFTPGTRKIPYNSIITNLICEKIIGGMTLTELSRLPGMPSYSTLSAWKKKYPEFNERIEDAYKERASFLAEQAVEEIQKLELGEHDSEDASVVRTKSDGLFKAASFGNREKFGTQTKVTGTVTTAVQLVVNTGINRDPNDSNYIVDETRKIKEAIEAKDRGAIDVEPEQ